MEKISSSAKVVLSVVLSSIASSLRRIGPLRLQRSERAGHLQAVGLVGDPVDAGLHAIGWRADGSERAERDAHPTAVGERTGGGERRAPGGAGLEDIRRRR